MLLQNSKFPQYSHGLELEKNEFVLCYYLLLLFSSSVDVLHFCHVMMSSVFQFFLQLVHLKNTRYLKVCVNVGALEILMLYSDRCQGKNKPHREQEYNKELKQPRRRRQEKPHKFAYLTMKNRIFARFARAFFIFLTFCRRSRSFYDVK